MKKNKFVLFFVVVLMFSFFLSNVQAQEEDEIKFLGLELENTLFFLNALLSLFLFVVVFVAYKRDGRRRMLYVSFGFLLFAVKNFLVSSELFLDGIAWVDPMAVFLEFIALLSFFYGVLKK